MKIFLLANNWTGWKVCEFLKEKNENIVGIAVHPENKQKYRDEILSAVSPVVNKIFDGSRLKERKILAQINELKPDIGISISFDYILSKQFLAIFPEGVINLHPSYLPYNRGQYPNVWSIVEGTPAGVTLHFIDEKIDTGPIIAQNRVPIAWTDTGETLFKKLEIASLDLFKRAWPDIKRDTIRPISQRQLEGTYHRSKDTQKIDRIDLNKKYLAKELINIIRARTFPPYESAFFMVNNKKIFIRAQLLTEKEFKQK